MSDDTNNDLATNTRWEISPFVKQMPELKILISQIFGYSNLLLNADEPLTPDQKEGLIAIHDVSNQLLAIYYDFYDLAKIETGILQIDLKRINVIPVIQSLVSQPLIIFPKGTEMQFKIDTPNIPLIIYADPGRIHHIIIEVARFLRDHGRGNKTFKLIVTYDDNWAYIKISSSETVDTQRIISEITNLESKTPIKKLGFWTIGFYIAYDLTKLHGGKLYFEANGENSGSLVIALPILTTTPPDGEPSG